MFLKNYTSNVPVTETIHRIEKVLIRCGVSAIAKQYVGTSGEIEAITFQIETANGQLPIRIPVNEKAALDALWADYVNGDALTPDGNALAWTIGRGQKKKKRADFVEQAKRTAWKIMQDWVEVQMSVIQMKQADTLQVFLPYVMVNRKQNYYQQLQESRFAGLLPEKASHD